MLDVQVDEFTLVLQSNKKPESFELWESIALNIIDKFIELTSIELVLSKLKETSSSLPMGYTQGIVSDNPDYYFAIAYHPDYIQMGVCIKFSARSWAEYRSNYKNIFSNSIQIHEFLFNSSNNNIYSSRLSRIDIAIDFINENVNVNSIYNQLSKKNQIIKTATGRSNNSSLSAITKDNITSTFYLGSKGKNIKALLRVYDKKKEQIETFGYQYEEALNFNNWIRFEAVFKSHYAHTLSEALLTIQNDNDLKNLLVSALTDRYQFYYKKSDKLTTFSRKMIGLLSQKNFNFISPSPRNNLLEQSQKHILNGSGLFPYLYKISSIWGEDGFNKSVSFLYDEFMNYEPNNDVVLWLDKYSALYKIQGYPFK